MGFGGVVYASYVVRDTPDVTFSRCNVTRNTARKGGVVFIDELPNSKGLFLHSKAVGNGENEVSPRVVIQDSFFDGNGWFT